MGCKTDIIQTLLYGAAGAYGIYKAVTWNNGFWKFIAGGLGAAGTILAAKEGLSARKECKVSRK